MLPPEILWPEVPFPLEPSLIIVGRRGSEAHGTYCPPTEPDAIDDRDLMGIVVPPLSYFLGLKRFDHAEAIQGVWDVVLYDVKKFLGLLCQQNPNVLSLLYLRPSDYLYVSAGGNRLLAARNLFKHKDAAHKAFVGYAYGQLKRMTHFGTDAFKTAYLGAKRKKLVEKYGYDTKNAAHLIRLLHMAEEYLGTGTMDVFRTWDRDLILSVKRGEWELARVGEYATKLFQQCHAAHARSPLPTHIDMDAVNQLCISIVEEKITSNARAAISSAAHPRAAGSTASTALPLYSD